MLTFRAVSAIVVSSFTILFAINAYAAEYDYAQTPLKERRLKSLDIEIPDWGVVEELDIGGSGKIKLADPKGQDRFFRISWVPGNTSIESIAFAFDKMGLTRLSSGDISVSGQKTPVLRFISESGTKQIAVAQRYCSNSDTGVLAASFINAEWNESLKLIERVLSSVRCNPVANTSVFPLFIPKTGYKKSEESRYGVGYRHKNGNILTFSSAQLPNRALNRRDAVESVFATYTKELGLQNAKFQDRPQQIGDKEVWAGSAQFPDGSKAFLMATWWKCMKPQSFLGLAIAPNGPFSTGDALLFASAKCP